MNKSNIYRTAIVIASFAFLTSLLTDCKKEELPVVILETHEATNITGNSATIAGEIISNEGLTITKRGICIGTNLNPTLLNGHVVSTSTTDLFNVRIENLNAASSFHYRAFAVTNNGVFYGNDLYFSTETGLPIIGNTAEITEISETTAISGGTLIKNGGLNTTRGVCWNTSSQPTINNSKTIDGTGTGTGDFTSNLTGLTPKTTYYVRAYATNSHGTVYGNEKQFRTLVRPWTKLADFAGAGRTEPVGFSINGKGYIGTGNKIEWGSPSVYYNYDDFWEYNPTTKTWAQIANFPGEGRFGAINFVIDDVAYVGGGESYFSTDGGYTMYTNNYIDFWQYNPAINSWTRKADFSSSFPGNGIYAGFCFSANGKGYIGLGHTNSGFWNQVGEYNPNTNSWLRKNDFPGSVRYRGISFAIGNKGYIGLGRYNYGVTYNDFWEYDAANDTWTQRESFPGENRTSATSFVIENKGYVTTGETSGLEHTKELWEYTPSNNTWIKKSDFKGEGRTGAVGFTINNKGYIGVGGGHEDFWVYDPSEDEDKK